jgi:two-component system LytT family response regulator
MLCLNVLMNNALRTLIVDDEALARRGLRHRLAQNGEVHIIAEARNGREALDLINAENPDLVFLDIQMPGMDGFDVLRALHAGELPPEKLPFIVFVTAFDDYAVQAFEAHALDYLLKPIDNERLSEALERVRQARDSRKAVRHRKSLLRLIGQITGEAVGSMEELEGKDARSLSRKDPPKLAIRDSGRTTWLPQDEIDWIDAAGDYMCVHAGGETYILRSTMKKLEKELDSAVLQRIHRSTIVNINRVREMQAHINGEYFLTLDNGHMVKLSRSYKHKLKYFG